MKSLTATICLTVVLLFGCAGVTFASDYYDAAEKVIFRYGAIILLLTLGAGVLWLIIKFFKDIEFSILNVFRVMAFGVGCLGFYELGMGRYGPHYSIGDYIEISWFVFCFGFSLYPLARRLWNQ